MESRFTSSRVKILAFVLINTPLLQGCKNSFLEASSDSWSHLLVSRPPDFDCSSPHVQRLIVPGLRKPWHPVQIKQQMQPTGAQVSLAYEWLNHLPTDDRQRTILLFAGGPSAIVGSAKLYRNLPDDVAVVRFDYRGLGCSDNKPPFQVRSDTLHSGYHAADALDLVRELGLKNYVVLGTSYGTMAATIFAGLVDKDEETAKPRAVVLDGIIGSHRKEGRHLYEVGRDNWTYLLNQIRPETKARLLGDASRPETKGGSAKPIEIKPAEWIDFLVNNTYINLYVDRAGEVRFLGKDLLEKLFGPDSTQADRQTAEVEFRKLSTPDYYLGANLYAETMTRHDRDQYRADIRWKDMALDIKGLRKVRSAITKFDSKKWQTSAPVYYFQGGFDGTTPEAHSWYHYQNRQKGRSYHTKLKEGAHGITLHVFDGSPECGVTLWNGIFAANHPRNFITKVNGCYTEGLTIGSRVFH